MLDLYCKIEKVFPAMEKFFSPEELLKFKNTAKEDLSSYNSGLGMRIRYELLLKDKALYNSFLKKGIYHPDSISSMLISEFHDYMCKKS